MVSQFPSSRPGQASNTIAMHKKILALFTRDTRNAMRSGGGWLHAVFFFSVFQGFSVFALGPDRLLLAAAAPALIWLGSMLALQFASIDLFAADLEDGTLHRLASENTSLGAYVFAKLIVLFTMTALPIMALTPLFFVLFSLSPPVAFKLSIVFILGVPSLVLSATLSAVLSASMRMSGMLGAALSVPLTIPVLIFGIGATRNTLETGHLISPEALILFALTLFYMVALPPFAISALRISLE